MPIVEAVLNKEVDFGILRTCEFESLVARGLVAPNTIKVVGKKPEDTFACLRSTDLYPDLIFAAQASLSPDIKRRLSATLLSMPMSGSGYGWTVGANLSETRHLVERLGYSPTVRMTGSSLMIDRYKYALLIGVLLLAARRAKAMLSKMDELGFGNCTNTRACEAECPKNISISNIARLNRDFILAKLKD